MTAYRQGKLQEAERGFATAADLFERAGDALQRAEMANNRAVVLLAMGRAGEARQTAAGTEQIFLQEGDSARAGKAVGNVAAAFEAEGEWAHAEQAYRRAAALLSEAGDRESAALALQSLSRVQLRRGRPLDAVAAMDSALAGPGGGVPRRFLRWLIRLPSRFLAR